MLKQQLTDAMKAAMKGGDKPRLAVIRLMLAAVKQREVDERIELDDAQVLAVLDKMVKQRRDSIQQYTDAGRTELADQEAAEIDVIQDFMPEALSEAEIASIIDAAIAETGAESMRDMGKVMGIVKPQVQGRADVGQVSALVKQKLG
ncbi:GatB/YqeY domain-containing protein [Thiosocius teredinicola]|uniref:GatB/YqeY domain-containing protein n=1 Tax=Thiosocius teredinicola TaxID=1973002 RepID=UPI000990FBB3